MGVGAGCGSWKGRMMDGGGGGRLSTPVLAGRCQAVGKGTRSHRSGCTRLVSIACPRKGFGLIPIRGRVMVARPWARRWMKSGSIPHPLRRCPRGQRRWTDRPTRPPLKPLHQFTCTHLHLLQMGRMHSGGKGMASSALPYKRTPPSWAKATPKDVEEHVCKLAKKGLTPSQVRS